MSIEDSIPSAPVAADFEWHGGRVFEQLRRPNVGDRRCAPCDNETTAVDRIVFEGRTGFLFHPTHEYLEGSSALRRDLIERDLGPLGFAARREFRGPKGQIDVITDDCPGVRLRALVDALKLRGTTLPHELAWHIVERTAALLEVWQRFGVKPIDTFVGFDGSVHLFPSLPACWEDEMPSWTGQEIYDPLLVDRSHERLGQLLCATLPKMVMTFDEQGIRIPKLAIPPDPAVAHAIEALLAAPPPSSDVTPALAALVRDCFPRTLERHRRVYESLGLALDGDGLAREASILALTSPAAS